MYQKPILRAVLALLSLSLADSVARPQLGPPRFDPKNSKWGYPASSLLAIAAKFDDARPFSVTDGLAVVKLGKKYYYINLQGQRVFNASFDFAGPFRNGVARVMNNNKFALIDSQGRPLTEFTFDDLGDLSDGLARAKKDGKFGFIDRFGKWVIPAKFDVVGDFSEGLACFRVNAKFGYLGIDQRVRINPTFDAADNFAAGRAAVQINGKYGYIDHKGAQVIPPIFEACRPFHTLHLGAPPFAAVKTNGKWGVINDKGTIEIDTTFEGVEGPIALRHGDNLALFRVISERDGEPPRLALDKTVANNALVPVIFKSEPTGAEVYQIEEYDAYKRSNDDLVRPEYRVGNTELPVKMDRNKAWRIVFVLSRNGQRIMLSLPCLPATVNGELKAVLK
jgi:hypothetical protein